MAVAIVVIHICKRNLIGSIKARERIRGIVQRSFYIVRRNFSKLSDADWVACYHMQIDDRLISYWLKERLVAATPAFRSSRAQLQRKRSKSIGTAPPAPSSNGVRRREALLELLWRRFALNISVKGMKHTTCHVVTLTMDVEETDKFRSPSCLFYRSHPLTSEISKHRNRLVDSYTHTKQKIMYFDEHLFHLRKTAFYGRSN